ncbi:MAG: SpoIIE family protein phosphatase [Verrucomicrobia bacterium]|nr:SpoIIE family protein phosphatase [Verrucomicrobiota bacterium]
MKRCASIRVRMMSWVLAVTVTILAAFILWSYFSARHRLEADMEARAFSLADGAARRIDAKLGVLQGVVNGMALTLESQELKVPFENVRAMQTKCLEENDGIYGVCVALEPGVAPTNWPDLAAWEYRAGDRLEYVDLAGAEYAHTWEDWYTLPKHLDRPVWSEPYEWEGVLMVTYSVPIYLGANEERRFAGVITCDLTLDWLEQMIKELPLGEDGYGLLMSRNGTYVSHPMPELVLNESVFSIAEQRGEPELRAVGQRMVSGRSGILPFVSFATGELSWLAFTSLESADWTMAALISLEEMRSEILKLSRRQAMVGFAGLLLLCLAVRMIARSITRPISNLRDAADTLANGNLDSALPVPCGKDEVASLTQAFGNMRDNLKRYMADLRKTTAARERMHSELRIAHDIQMGLVPKTFPPIPVRNDLDLFAVIEPAREVGGDFYDFFLLDEKRMVVAIGDVSGKGVPAALFMAVTRSFLRSAFRSDTDPAEVMTHVNAELNEGNESCMFVTLFFAVFDLSDGSLQYVNAGHNPPIILNSDGTLEWISSPRGPAAGVIEDAVYATGKTTLPAGAALILYTDGVTEAMNSDETLYGEERLEARLSASGGLLSCRRLIDELLADIMEFTAGAEQSDDITILALKQKCAESTGNGDCEVDGNLRKRIVFDSNTDALYKAIKELDEFLGAHNASSELSSNVRLALEELATNIIKYAYNDNDRHRLEVDLRLANPATMTITDDGRPFNPLEDAPAPTLEGAIEDRPIGGLGLHMIRSMGMKMEYRRENERNILRVIIPAS